MAHKSGPVAVALLVLMTGCTTNDSPQAGTTPSQSVTGTAGYTSDQLRQALLGEVATYVRAGEPDSGSYEALKAIRNFEQLQGQVTLDKPRCNGAARLSQGDLQTAPAALATFSKATGQTVTETLVAVPAAVADREIQRRVSSLCRTFRTKVGNQWSTHQVVESTPDRHLIGDGSRTVGLVTMSGTVKVPMWFVVFKARGYLGTVTVYGPGASRVETERIGQAAYDQAELILP